MTLCCQCSGVTPPPPPNPGACCSKVLGEIETQCDDDVAYGDCLVREMGIHHPDKTCAQLRIDNGYPSQRTDWPEPACDLLGSCCFYFKQALSGLVNRACQNAVPSGTCEVGETIGGRQSWTFHRASYLSESCPDGSANGTPPYCEDPIFDIRPNCNCTICVKGDISGGTDECAALNRIGPVTIVQDFLGGPDDGYPIFSTGVPCSCNGIDAGTPLYQDACCLPPPPPCDDAKICCYNEGEHCFAGICSNLECCSDEGGPLSCPDYPTLPNFTCDQLAECFFTTWPSTGWELIESGFGDDCRACKPTTTTTTTEAPRGACCGRDLGTIIDGACVGGTVYCFDNYRLSDCEGHFQANGCVLGFHENKICSQVDCSTATTTSTIPPLLCPGSCDYVCQSVDFGGWNAYQWIVMSNNCGSSGGTQCCCPDLGNGGISDQCSSGQTQNLTNCREDCSEEEATTTTTTTTTATPLGACCWWFNPGPMSICNGSQTEYTCGLLGDYPEDNTWHSGADCDSVSCEGTTTSTTTTAAPTPTTSTTATTTSTTTTTTSPSCGTAITCCPGGLLYRNICCGSDDPPTGPIGTCDYTAPTTSTTSTTEYPTTTNPP